MTSLFSYFDSTTRPAESLAVRMLRTASIVANAWGVLAGALLFFTMEKHSPVYDRLRIFAVVAIVMGLGMFSLILPLHHMLKQHEKEQVSRLP